jgi:hypothetical protein
MTDMVDFSEIKGEVFRCCIKSLQKMAIQPVQMIEVLPALVPEALRAAGCMFLRRTVSALTCSSILELMVFSLTALKRDRQIKMHDHIGHDAFSTRLRKTI